MSANRIDPLDSQSETFGHLLVGCMYIFELLLVTEKSFNLGTPSLHLETLKVGCCEIILQVKKVSLMSRKNLWPTLKDEDFMVFNRNIHFRNKFSWTNINRTEFTHKSFQTWHFSLEWFVFISVLTVFPFLSASALLNMMMMMMNRWLRLDLLPSSFLGQLSEQFFWSQDQAEYLITIDYQFTFEEICASAKNNPVILTVLLICDDVACVCACWWRVSSWENCLTNEANPFFPDQSDQNSRERRLWHFHTEINSD